MVSKQSSFLSPAALVAGIAFLIAMAEANPLSTRNEKKGLAFSVGQSCNTLTEHTTSSWYYSWGTRSGFSNGFCDDPSSAETQAENDGIDFVPMFWSSIPEFDGTRMNDDEIHSNLQKTEYLLTFNEPELEEQANLSAATVAEWWPQIEAIAAAYKLKIVAPCVTQDLGMDWYEDWTIECNAKYGQDCKFDYTCIHMYYQPFTEDPSERCDSSDKEWACIQQGSEQGPTRAEYKLNQWATAYPNKPIWVTELACAPWGSDNGCSAQEQTDVMNQLVPVLEASPDVYRYAWFAAYGGHGDGGDWVGNGLNENIWESSRGVGCENKKWKNAFGTDSWMIQTKQQCLELAEADEACVKPLALSMDDDACYCATTTCNLVPTWGAMHTYVEVGTRGSGALTAMGDLYETFGAPSPVPDPTSSPTISSSASPTVSASAAPTVSASAAPTVSASAAPTVSASAAPSASASASPTVSASDAPSVSGPAVPSGCYDYSNIFPLDIDYRCEKRGLFLDIRARFRQERSAASRTKRGQCGGLTDELMRLTDTDTGEAAHIALDEMCKDHMADWDTPWSRVGSPSVHYDYSEVLEVAPGKCTGRALFLHIRKQFMEQRKTVRPPSGGLARELMALTGTLDSAAAHRALHDMCGSTLEEASLEVDDLGWGQLETDGSINLEEFFQGAGFLNDETGNFQQEEKDFRGGRERFNYIGNDPRKNDHYPTTEASYQGGLAISSFKTDSLGKSFLSSPSTSGLQDGSCPTSNAAVCCWHRDRQYFDKNGNCGERDCANQNPGDNTDLCWTEDENGTIFPYPGDDTEKDLHCHGFAWAQDDLAPLDTNARAKWNNLFFVSLFDHLYQRGYADSITDDPSIAGQQAMCGCVEDMNPVARADCTEAVGTVSMEASQLEEGGRLTLRFVPGTFKLNFQACEGFDYVEDFGPEDYSEFGDEELTRSNNDLSAFVFRQYIEGKLDEAHVETIEQTIIGYRDPSVNDSDANREIACQAAFEARYPDVEYAEREIVDEL